MIDIKAENKNIIAVLDDIFSNSPLAYKAYDNNLIVIVPKVLLPQQKVTGIIHDSATGEALAGVNVVVQGTLTGAVTDINGKFSIDINDPNAVLTCSFIGYVTQKIPLTEKTIDITLVLNLLYRRSCCSWIRNSRRKAI